MTLLDPHVICINRSVFRTIFSVTVTVATVFQCFRELCKASIPCVRTRIDCCPHTTKQTHMDRMAYGRMDWISMERLNF